MAYMGGLVRIDAGVFDKTEAGAADVGVLVCRDAAGDGCAVEMNVEIAGTGDFYTGHAFESGQPCGPSAGNLGGNLGCDRAGCLAETFGKFEGYRQSKFTECDRGRLLDRQMREGDIVPGKENGLNPGR